MKKLLVTFFTTMIIACGGGGSDTKDTDLEKYTPDTVPDHLRAEFEAMLYVEHYEAASAISGLFKIDLDGDQTFILIPTISAKKGQFDGFSITAYNYMGDAIDGSSDCYLPPDEISLNWAINTGTAPDGIGTKFEYFNRYESRSGNNEFIAKIHGGELIYEVAAKYPSLVKVTFNGQTSFDGNLIDADKNVMLSTDKQEWGMINIIEANQCKGMPAKYAPQGFVGVYDTSLELYGSYNENYLNIDANGRITAWDYMGDGALDLPVRNCYKRDHFYNNKLSGLSALYNQNEKYLYVIGGANPYEMRWYLNDEGNVTSVGAPDSISGLDKVEVYHRSTDFIGISAKRATISIEDIESMECID